MPSLFGGFSDTAVITTDPDPKKTDPYVKAEVIPSRYTGANFKVTRPKKGHGKDAYFSKDYLTFAVPEQNGKVGKTDDYLDSGVAARREAKESKKRNIDEHDFKYSSYPKRSTGPGSHFGTFDGKPIPHQEDYKVQKRGEPSAKRDVKVPRNILTSPAKRGTYGYIGTTFSKIEGPKASDDYDAIRKRESEAWTKSKEKMITQSTFKSTIRTKRTFDEKGNTGISSAFDAYDAPEEKKKSKKKAVKPTEDKSKIEGRPVFKYSSAPRSGQPGCLNPFPNSRDEKVPDLYESARIKAAEDKKKAPAPLGGVWKPTQGPKTAVVRSLLKTYY
jgi:hypothetical protein